MLDFSPYEQKYGLPPGLLNAVMMQESGGNEKAVSPAGAQGLFQFMPATAKDLGVDPFNPESAADGAARYLKQNLDKFGSLDLALAAYNAGPGNVEKHKGIPPFEETQKYVPAVLEKISTKVNEKKPKFTKEQIRTELERRKSIKAGGEKPQFTKEQIKAEMERRRGVNAKREKTIKEHYSGPLGKFFSASDATKAGVLDAATFGLKDEATAGIMATPSLFTEEKYSDAFDRNLKNIQGFENKAIEENPALYGSGLLATGIRGGSGALGKGIENITRTGLLPKATGALGKSANFATKMGIGASASYPLGVLYGYGMADAGADRIQAAKESGNVSAILGGVFPALGPAYTGIKNSIIPVVDDAVKPLAKRAKEFGIPLRADQVAPSKARKTVQKISQELPFSGADNFEDSQRKAYTKAVAKTIGEEAEDLGPDTIERFVDKNSSVFERLVGDRKIDVDLEDVKKISRLRSNVDKALGVTSRDAKILKTEIKEIADQLSDGPVTGKKLANIRSDLLKKSTTAGQGKPIFSDMIEQIDDMAKNSLTEEGKKELAQARRHYRNFKTLEPLLEESTDGQINPTKLLNRVKSSKYIKASRTKTGEDDLVDLARIGKEFLPKLGGSDTFQKGAFGLTAKELVTAGTGAAAFADLGLTAGTLAANKGLQRGVLTNQSLVDMGLRSPVLNPALTGSAAPAIGAAGGGLRKR